MKLIDITGQKFSRLTVVRLEELKKRKIGTMAMWRCVCDCGNISIVSGGSLKQGTSRSCGCLQKELVSIRASTHGASKQRSYRIWAGMLSRCNNKSAKDYKYYGGRGVKVCERWMNYSYFMSDMGEPGIKYTIERIDCNGNYEPTNCKWATLQEQSLNKRTSVKLEFDGVVLNLKQWATKLGMCEASLRGRLKKYSVEMSLSTAKGLL